jgi:hypothetical protein
MAAMILFFYSGQRTVSVRRRGCWRRFIADSKLIAMKKRRVRFFDRAQTTGSAGGRHVA